ncbi:LLM class flavin-dependent oxidoreductase [Pedobacter aquatilis]|uniref:LLM class flavin-dependent oxidoreductase n=1 Tax=Pedobacter aquatilis TaxID=351343 RepID=UPI0025B2D19A|nr:LLM class flavin-dependent oxidoreductase [Pedobacter aquatilis]MDN3586070.1 LLM class flavin-dependent oxidoreductase [Pedobacter aquatilis]
MKNHIKYSILEIASVSEGIGFKQTLNNSLELAKAADECGYTRFWFAEHHNTDTVASNATSVLIGYVAGNTEHIRVGSGGIMLPNHSPLIVAEQFGTLAQLYPGRIDLGLGRATGTDTATAMAIRSDFMQAARSFPEEINKIEQYFDLENSSAKVRVAIAEGVDVPLYILGSSTDSAHLAAARGLPYVFGSHFAPAQLYHALDIYKREFQPSSVLNRPYTIAGVNVIIADTDAEAQILFTSLIKMFYGIFSGASRPLQPPVDMDDDLIGMFHHPTVQQTLKYSFVGSKATVKGAIQRFLEATAADELMVSTNIFRSEDRTRSTRLFAQVMREINDN